MRKISVAAGAVLFGAFMAVGPAAYAGTSVPFFYNSSDHDAKVRFIDVGDKFELCKLNNARVYVEYIYKGDTNAQAWDGAIDSCHTFDHNFQEGVEVTFKVCEHKESAPDDCSGYRVGIA